MWDPCSLALLTFCTACLSQIVHAEMFTSMAHLEKALFAERDIAAQMRQYIKQEEIRLEQLKRLADDFDNHSAQALKNPVSHLSNPVSAFLFVKRFTLDWDQTVATAIRNNTLTDLTNKVEYMRQDLPTYEDLNGAAAALLRLQDTYQLETDRIASGDIAGIKSSQLTARDCFELGKIAYLDQDFYHTVLWMTTALSKLLQEEVPSAKKSDILDYLAFSIYKQGNVQHALTLTDELLVLEPNHDRAINNRNYYLRMLEEEDKRERKRGDTGERPIQNKPKTDEYRTSNEFLTYERLCRGENIKPYKLQHKLVCRYRNNNHPLLIVQPLKEEEVYLNPWMVIFHDVLMDNEIETIKKLATPRLNRATVHNVMTGKLETATYRVSKSAWLREEDHPIIGRVNARIEAGTGLAMDTAEELQVANYGLGGHYEPHYDFARKEEKDAFASLGTGNRIATFLSYMTDVEAGGATVFPHLGIKIFPRKGVAAFWYNLYRSGDGIYDTRHAACPVLVGHKWVSNKWIHERGQEFRRPCALSRNK